ncbi:MAG: hypothetical protein KAS32_29415 [Candidatus Peribacteraceae bacterium]|nr:hypothetical protein [Candidatus Peribacteraceae bacterium]
MTEKKKPIYGKGSNAAKYGDLVTFGNNKMDALAMFSLPAGKTCKGSTELCRKYCYAMAPQKMFVAVMNKRDRNFKESKKSNFIKRICADLEGYKEKYFRIHDSGEFYSQAYLNKWSEIARLNPKIKFLAFTKNFKLDYSEIPNNFKIIYSVFPDSKNVPEGRKAFTIITYKSFEGENPDVGKAKKCKGHCNDCLMCFNKKHNVYFNVHR